MGKKNKFGLSNSQKLLLLFQLLNRKKNDGNVCGSITIKQKIDTDKLEKAINKFIENNDSVRTRICFTLLGFKQYFAEYEPIKVEVIEVESEQDVKDIEDKINHEVFSMIEKPLYKIKIFKFKDGTGGFIGCMHHIICDAWTIGLTINEILSYYTESGIEYPRYSYAEYVKSEKQYLKSNRIKNDKKYWDNLVKNDLPPAAIIEGDLNIEDKARKCGNNIYCFEKSTINKINEYCNKIKISQCSFITGVYSLYIGKRANLNKFILDVILSNRSNYKEKNTIGLFAKTAGTVAKIENTSFEKYILEINKELSKTYKHYKYSTSKILKKVHKLEPKRKRLSKIWFSFQNAKADTKSINFPYTTRWTPLETTYLYDMLIELYDLNNDGSLNIIYYYLLSKYSKKRIDEIHNGICSIINQVIENNNINIEDIIIDENSLAMNS